MSVFVSMPSTILGGCHAIAVGDAIWALPEELFSAEGAKCIGDQLANLLSANYPNANRSRQTYKSTSTR